MHILQGRRPLTASEVEEERVRIQKTGHALYNEAGRVNSLFQLPQEIPFTVPGMGDPIGVAFFGDRSVSGNA